MVGGIELTLLSNEKLMLTIVNGGVTVSTIASLLTRAFQFSMLLKHLLHELDLMRHICYFKKRFSEYPPLEDGNDREI